MCDLGLQGCFPGVPLFGGTGLGLQLLLEAVHLPGEFVDTGRRGGTGGLRLFHQLALLGLECFGLLRTFLGCRILFSALSFQVRHKPSRSFALCQGFGGGFAGCVRLLACNLELSLEFGDPGLQAAGLFHPASLPLEFVLELPDAVRRTGVGFLDGRDSLRRAR